MDRFARLKPATKRLKQVVTEHGPKWRVLLGPERPPCFDGDTGFFLESLDGAHRRWVRVTHLTPWSEPAPAKSQFGLT